MDDTTRLKIAAATVAAAVVIQAAVACEKISQNEKASNTPSEINRSK